MLEPPERIAQREAEGERSLDRRLKPALREGAAWDFTTDCPEMCSPRPARAGLFAYSLYPIALCLSLNGAVLSP